VVIFIFVYIVGHIRLLANQIGFVMLIDAPTRILAKRQRKEVKILKSIIIQVGIYSTGGIPVMVITICSQISASIRISFQIQCCQRSIKSDSHSSKESQRSFSISVSQPRSEQLVSNYFRIEEN